jgi:hypothetical protein
MPRYGIYLKEAAFSRTCECIRQTLSYPASTYAATIPSIASVFNKVNPEQVPNCPICHA